MGLFDKLKNVFTEEIEEDEVVKKEVRQVEIVAPKELEEKQIEEPEEKNIFPVFFDDDDFKELEPKKIEKEVPKKEIYGIKNREEKEEKKVKKFTPSPVISPVYGVLNKNYNKEDIVDKNSTYVKSRRSVTLDDVRRKAYGSLQDDLENSLFNDDPIYMEKDIEEKDLFEELEPLNEVEEKIVADYKENKFDDIEDNITLEALNNLSEDDDLNMSENDLFSLIDSMYEKDDNNE